MEYDRFAEIYGVWTDTAESAQANLGFYRDAYTSAPGVVAELGIGDGRIAIEAARLGTRVVGVDLSPVMLERCRARAAQAGVLDRLTLLQGDFRGFTLPEPAALIALPYHSLGHLTTLDAKREAIRRVYAQLAPGGRFIFDDFQMTPARLDSFRQVQLRASFPAADGTERLLWVTSLVDAAAQTMRVVTWEDALAEDGVLRERRYRPLSLSWLTPAQAQALLEDAGFTVEACYGDFERAPFADDAPEQVWVARKERVS